MYFAVHLCFAVYTLNFFDIRDINGLSLGHIWESTEKHGPQIAELGL